MTRSAVITAAAARLRQGETELFPVAYLSDADGVLTMRGVYEIAPAPRPRRIAAALLGMWALSALTLAGGLIVILAGLMWGMAALSAIGGGR